MSEKTALDPINVVAGKRFAAKIGWGDPNSQMVVEYALSRWAKGEEAYAERTALRHMGSDMTSWRMILAVAMAGAAGLGEETGK